MQFFRLEQFKPNRGDVGMSTSYYCRRFHSSIQFCFHLLLLLLLLLLLVASAAAASAAAAAAATAAAAS